MARKTNRALLLTGAAAVGAWLLFRQGKELLGDAGSISPGGFDDPGYAGSGAGNGDFPFSLSYGEDSTGGGTTVTGDDQPPTGDDNPASGFLASDGLPGFEGGFSPEDPAALYPQSPLLLELAGGGASAGATIAASAAGAAVKNYARNLPDAMEPRTAKKLTTYADDIAEISERGVFRRLFKSDVRAGVFAGRKGLTLLGDVLPYADLPVNIGVDYGFAKYYPQNKAEADATLTDFTQVNLGGELGGTALGAAGGLVGGAAGAFVGSALGDFGTTEALRRAKGLPSTWDLVFPPPQTEEEREAYLNFASGVVTSQTPALNNVLRESLEMFGGDIASTPEPTPSVNKSLATNKPTYNPTDPSQVPIQTGDPYNVPLDRNASYESPDVLRQAAEQQKDQRVAQSQRAQAARVAAQLERTANKRQLNFREKQQRYASRYLRSGRYEATVNKRTGRIQSVQLRGTRGARKGTAANSNPNSRKRRVLPRVQPTGR